MAIHIKRIYEPFSAKDEFRVLTDRLWPRGIKKENAHIDLWLKEVAPTTPLRLWFDHDPEKWKEFRKKYLAELKGSEALKELRACARQNNILTLLFAAKEEKYNHTVILRELLKKSSARK
jgi:uncharacterized protein YeaO (DUF488 family)